jgi:AraC-like DNA-binding protein
VFVPTSSEGRVVILVRGTSLSGFIELVDGLGGDGARLLTEVGISPAAIGDFGDFIEHLKLVEVMELAARETGTVDFGRRLAARQGIEVIGSVGAAARSAPTVRAALVTIERYLRAYTPALTTRMVPEGPRAERFEFTRTVAGLPAYPQGAELTIGVAVQVFRALIGPAWRPRRIDFPHDPLSSVAAYEADFGCPVRFGRPSMALLIDETDLERPLSSDAGTHDALVSYLQSITPLTPTSMVPTVRDLIRRLLPGGTVELASVAAQLGMHPRTLQRRLEDEGVTFAELVQDVRRRTAETYLRDTDMSLRHLATELGYTEQSAFTRASRRWFGMSPLAYRRTLRQSVS